MLKFKKIYFYALGLFSYSVISYALSDPTTQSNFDKRYPDIQCYSSSMYDDQGVKMNFIKNWAAFVAKQAFGISHENLNQQLKSIRPCFSEEGWQEFSTALSRSGNLDLIRTNQYESSTQVIGMIAISHEAFTKVWETNIPLQVVYQNHQHRLTQELTIHLRIEETPNQTLKVTQIVGLPQTQL